MLFVDGDIARKGVAEDEKEEKQLPWYVVEGLGQKFPDPGEGKIGHAMDQRSAAGAPGFHHSRPRRRRRNGIRRLGLVGHEGCESYCERGDAYALQRQESAEVTSDLLSIYIGGKVPRAMSGNRVVPMAHQ